MQHRNKYSINVSGIMIIIIINILLLIKRGKVAQMHPKRGQGSALSDRQLPIPPCSKLTVGLSILPKEHLTHQILVSKAGCNTEKIARGRRWIAISVLTTLLSVPFRAASSSPSTVRGNRGSSSPLFSVHLPRNQFPQFSLIKI